MAATVSVDGDMVSDGRTHRACDSRQGWFGTVVDETDDDERGSRKPSGGLKAERGRLLADLRPLRESPEYRRLWMWPRVVGDRQPDDQRGCARAGLCNDAFVIRGRCNRAHLAIPLIVVGLLGGSLAMRAPTGGSWSTSPAPVSALLSFVFALQAALNLRQLWLLYVVIALQGGLFAIPPCSKARSTFVPRLLPSDRIPAAQALNQLSFQLSGTIGPLLAGVVIAAAGLKAAYATDAATFAIAVYAIVKLRPMPPQGGGAPPGFAAVAEGLRWARKYRSSRWSSLST